MSGERLIPAETLGRFLRAVMRAAGLPETEAGIMAEALLRADLRGMHSHGAVRVPIYVAKIRAGGFRPGLAGRVLKDGPAVRLIDAQDGIGQVFAMRAMDEAIGKARGQGIGACGVINSNHFGEGAPYVLRAAEAGLVGLIATNSAAIMPVWGGRVPMTGPLPVTIAAPAGRHPPFVLDAALGATSRGKLLVAAAEGRKVPPGVGTDAAGRPTDDPRAILDGGAILPIGGHKGWGIILALEILSGVLTGGALGAELHDLFDPDRGAPQRLAHFAIAIDVAHFMLVEAFRARMDALIDGIKASERAEGVEEILIPGEIEHRRESERRRTGVPLGPGLIAELDALAAELGVAERLG